MNCFLSYARLDWNIVRDALGDEDKGFLACLQHALRQKFGSGSHVFRDKPDLKEGRRFDDQLYGLIDRSSVFLILYSHNWLASDWCWQELDHALTRIPNIVLVPIIFEMFDLSSAKVFNGRDADAVRLHEEVLRVETSDLAKPFVPALRDAYRQSDGRDTSMSDFAEGFLNRIKEALEKPAETLLWRNRAAKAIPSTPTTAAVRHLTIQGKTVEFVRIPAGDFECNETGKTHRIERPFLIMSRAMPAKKLFPESSGGGQKPLTLGDLVAPGLRTDSGSVSLLLPTEDQWEWAMLHGAPAAGPGLPKIGGWTRHVALVLPDATAKEPASAVSVPRRAYADLTGPARRELGFKWVEGGKPCRQTPLREDRKLGTTHLRLVAPISHGMK